MNTKTLIALAMASTLAACSIAIPVTKISEHVPAEREGTLLILPRTELKLSYSTEEQTFSTGVWTGEVEACAKSEKDAKALHLRAAVLDCNGVGHNSDQCKAIFGNSEVRNSCIEIADLGLRSKRFSTAEKAEKCPGDGGDSEFRREFDIKSLSITGTPVPDPDQVYWVETPARTFGDTQVGINYTATGTVAGAKSVASNPYVAFGTEVAGIAFGSILGGTGSSDAAEKKTWTCKDADTDCPALRADLKHLKTLMEAEAKFLANISKDSPSSQVLLVAKQAQTAEARNLFEGTVKKKEKANSVTWIPRSADRLLAKVPDAGKCETPAGSDIPVPNGACIEQRICADGDDGKPSEIPKDRLYFSARRAPEGAVLAAAISPTLEFTVKGDPGARKAERGFPYRAPIQSEAHARVVRYLAQSDDESHIKTVGVMPKARLAIAQFGEIGFLAPRAGGKSGTIEAKYFVDTGALETLSIQGVGADPAPLLNPIKTALTPTPETDPLKAEKDRLETLQAICVAAAALNDPLPDFCKT